MVAAALLADMSGFLAAANLQPAPVLIGVAEPVNANELPALVLSLQDLVVPEPAFERQPVQMESGALAVTAVIDLAAPVLPDDPTVDLLNQARLRLILPQGGLVTSDGAEGPLAAADVQVEVDGVPLTLVAAAPVAGQFAVEPIPGALVFGAPLAAAGSLSARYHLGRWQRSLLRLAGMLEVAAVAGNNADAGGLGDLVLAAMDRAVAAVAGLRALDVALVGPVTRFADSNSRRVRRLAWRFDYQQIVDRPDSAGGVIQRVALISRPDSLAEEDAETEEIT